MVELKYCWGPVYANSHFTGLFNTCLSFCWPQLKAVDIFVIGIGQDVGALAVLRVLGQDYILFHWFQL